MKTLLYILPDKDAGVASVVRNLCRYRSNQFKVKVVLLHEKHADKSYRIKDEFNADEIVRLTYNGGRFGFKYQILKKIKEEIDTDSILVSNDGGIDLDVIGFYNLKIPVVYIMHGNYQHYYKVLSSKIDSINQVITVSDYLYKEILNYNKKTSIHSIKFPVPTVELVNRKKSNTIRLVFVGSLTQSKGVFTLPKIVEELTSKKINFSLNIIGNGADRLKLDSILATYDNVKFLGKLRNLDVMKSHENHDIILLPSRNEGLPVVLVEAMKSGVVPMATNLETGIPELIEQGKTGFQVPLDDAKQYASHITTLFHNPSQLSTMQNACIAKANAMFAPYEQTQAYEAVFSMAKSVNVNMPFKQKIAYFVPNLLVHRLRKIKKNVFR